MTYLWSIYKIVLELITLTERDNPRDYTEGTRYK